MNLQQALIKAKTQTAKTTGLDRFQWLLIQAWLEGLLAQQQNQTTNQK